MIEPVEELPEEGGRSLEDGIGIALSGGGYRAMMFHLGSLLRLVEADVIEQAARISSVSGGSITSAKLALELHRVGGREDYLEYVAKPIRQLASTTIDGPSILSGVMLPGSVADRIADRYDRILFHGATLQDLPDQQRFVINATNVETGSLWRFMKPAMRDYKIGEILKPTLRVAEAVTASSAFPPVLSPYTLDVSAEDFARVEPGVDPAFLEDVTLTDGGVYDNLGLETVYKRYKTILVSDAGGALAPDPTPPGDWLRHTKRVLDIVHGQVSSVRVRQLIEAFQTKQRLGGYWGIRTDIADYKLPDALPAPFDRTTALARTPTRLKRMPDALQDRLANWGYAVCDAAIRSRWDGGAKAPPPRLPYPANPI